MQVQLNTARLAKERGFNEFTEGFYYPESYGARILFEDAINVNKTHYDVCPEGVSLLKSRYNTNHATSLTQADFIAAPTQSELQKWLREKHNVDIVCDLRKPRNSPKKAYISIIYGGKFHSACSVFESYEEALEEGLVQVLTHYVDEI